MRIEDFLSIGCKTAISDVDIIYGHVISKFTYTYSLATTELLIKDRRYIIEHKPIRKFCINGNTIYRDCITVFRRHIKNKQDIYRAIKQCERWRDRK